MFNRFNLTQNLLLHQLNKENCIIFLQIIFLLIRTGLFKWHPASFLHFLKHYLQRLPPLPPVITTNNNHKSRFKRLTVAAHGCHKSDLDSNADSSEPERRSHQNAKRAQRRSCLVLTSTSSQINNNNLGSSAAVCTLGCKLFPGRSFG